MRTVSVRWSGGDPGTFTVDVDDDANVSDLKNAIERVTSVRHLSMQVNQSSSARKAGDGRRGAVEHRKTAKSSDDDGAERGVVRSRARSRGARRD